jgi:hypothetical protein
MDVDNFLRDGYTVVRGAFDAETAAACRDAIWTRLEDHGVECDDRRTWTKPLVRINCPDGEPFVVAGTAAVLADAYDELLGPDRWTRRAGVGGTIPVRFPSEAYPGEVGYHIEGSYNGEGGYWANVRSRARGLLALFLFSDTGSQDAPTRLVVGSHLYIPPILARSGDAGELAGPVVGDLRPSVLCRRTVEATGRAGDVFLCHPFVVHTATWPHRGTEPRMMAQPGIEVLDGFELDGTDPSPVARAIVAGLDRAPD